MDCEGGSPAEGAGAGTDGGAPNQGGAPAGGGDQGGAGGQSPSPVHVTVVEFFEDLPLAGLDVISNDADGSLVDQGVTDAIGEVDVIVPDGGSVTLVVQTPVDYPGIPDYSVKHIDTIFFEGPPTDTARFRIKPDAPFNPDYEYMDASLSYPPKAGQRNTGSAPRVGG